MKKSTRWICCATLGIAATLLPVKAKAVTDDDKKFLAMAAQSDQNEIALSQLAEQKATNPAVKAFAEKMVKEHTQMTASMKPFADSWGLTAPTGPDPDSQKELDKLNGLSGNDFDKEYIDQMVTDHTEALKAFTTEAKDTKDVSSRPQSSRARPPSQPIRTWPTTSKRSSNNESVPLPNAPSFASLRRMGLRTPATAYTHSSQNGKPEK
jgi:putative membrane protein